MSNDQPQDDPGSRRWMPPELSHLAFLGRLPDIDGMELEERLKFFRGRVAAFKRHAAELDRHEVAYKEILAMLEIALAREEAEERVRTATGDELLHAMADLADVRTDTARITVPLAERFHATTPFEPMTQEIKEAVDELRKEVPKDL